MVETTFIATENEAGEGVEVEVLNPVVIHISINNLLALNRALRLHPVKGGDL